MTEKVKVMFVQDLRRESRCITNMTESEARSKIKHRISIARQIAGNNIDNKTLEDLEIAVKVLKEIRQYRELGTIEELKALKDKKNCNEVIKEFAKRLKTKIELKYCRADLTSQYVGMQTCEWIDEIAEEMRDVE